MVFRNTFALLLLGASFAVSAGDNRNLAASMRKVVAEIAACSYSAAKSGIFHACAHTGEAAMRTGKLSLQAGRKAVELAGRYPNTIYFGLFLLSSIYHLRNAILEAEERMLAETIESILAQQAETRNRERHQEEVAAEIAEQAAAVKKNAATKIQAAARGMIDRNHVNRIRHTEQLAPVLEEFKHNNNNKAATKIQAAARGMIARRHYAEMRKNEARFAARLQYLEQEERLLMKLFASFQQQ